MSKEVKVSIRNAKLSDCIALTKLINTPELQPSLANINFEEYLKEAVKKSKLFFIAEMDKKIVGFVLAEEILGKCAYAHLISIDSNHRKIGIGGNLIEHLKKQAKNKGIKYLFFFAPKKDNLEKFYKNHNFNKKNGEYSLFDISP